MFKTIIILILLNNITGACGLFMSFSQLYLYSVVHYVCKVHFMPALKRCASSPADTGERHYINVLITITNE